MKRKRTTNQYLLIAYSFFKLAYLIGSLPLKTLRLLFGLIKQAVILFINTIKLIIKQILSVTNILIVYVYRLRYVFLVSYAVYLGYLASIYYQSIPNPKSENDFLVPGNILILDRDQLTLFDSQKINQQLIEKGQKTGLNNDQLANRLAERVRVGHPDLLKRKIIALRIKNNFPESSLEPLYLYLSNYAVFDYDHLNIYKRSPVVVSLLLSDLTNKYSKDNLISRNLKFETSISQTLQNSLQEIAVENKQLENQIIVYQADTKQVIAVINQKISSMKDFKKIVMQKGLSLIGNQTSLNNNFEFIAKSNNQDLLNIFTTEIKHHYLISALNLGKEVIINE